VIHESGKSFLRASLPRLQRPKGTNSHEEKTVSSRGAQSEENFFGENLCFSAFVVSFISIASGITDKIVRMVEYELVYQTIPIADYQRLRQAVGWNVVDDDSTKHAYIQDIIVQPDHQKKGIGRMIMDAVMNYLKAHAAENALIGLMAAQGMREFYVKYRFAERT
jgi:ribosomal protein S18 acetylase RimI-like enzyme